LGLIDTASAVAFGVADEAEEEGFEPPEPCGSTVFKTAAFDRSATPLCFLRFFGSANVYVYCLLANISIKIPAVLDEGAFCVSLSVFYHSV
jgi:hypothetical protein